LNGGGLKIMRKKTVKTQKRQLMWLRRNGNVMK